ncbi:MAG: hypothetical protein MJZ26_11200 [Fibrobacter sp.]|nr:hypothetical protein [Fibrobacter sp.]
MKIKFEDIPFATQLKLRNQAVDICDSETPTMCYCGRLATGFHTQQCRKFESKARKHPHNQGTRRQDHERNVADEKLRPQIP